MIKIVALIGEAGSGKDTIMQNLLKKYPQYFNEIISCTTRPIREGEINGVNYYFLTSEDFLDKVAKGEMLEATSFNGWYYGTGLLSVKENAINLGVFNPAGIYTLSKNENIELTVFKIECSDKIRLLRQLNREHNPNVDEIIRRYKTDKIDFSNLKFHYTIVENIDEEDLDLASYAIMTELGLIS